MKENYTQKDQRKKILLLCDDLRMHSGISTMARELILGTAHVYNWVNIGGAIQHADAGKRLDLSDSINKETGIEDSSVILYPTNGYGDQMLVKQIMNIEKPDMLMIFTDPRYWVWLFQMEHEIRVKTPIIYLNIWDDLPYPMYNKSFYESCDALLAISKQTENINRVVLGELSENKVIKYIPHGINEDKFYPIDKSNIDYLSLKEFKQSLFKNKEYDFVLLYNARNIRRKSVPDLMLAWKIFIDNIDKEKAEKAVLLLHTQASDENGTDLVAVKEMLFGNHKHYNVIILDTPLDIKGMNLLYNTSDAVALISSNEGWGLSLTEAMMCGKPIIATVTGGMQDQMRFEDENGEWIKFTEEFGSNHHGKYRTHGIWANPVFPSNISLIGSVPTPYIYDDRANPKDVAYQIRNIWSTKHLFPNAYDEACKAARKWVTSDESMMSARWMSKNFIDAINETLSNWKPREQFSFTKIEQTEQPRHYVKFPIAI